MGWPASGCSLLIQFPVVTVQAIIDLHGTCWFNNAQPACAMQINDGLYGDDRELISSTMHSQHVPCRSMMACTVTTGN